jgi:hypothetical protein
MNMYMVRFIGWDSSIDRYIWSVPLAVMLRDVTLYAGGNSDTIPKGWRGSVRTPWDG